jgi:SAM-dependent methyltransferase
VQIATARQEAVRRGLAAAATIVHGDFTALPAGPFDVVLAIESLGHARDLDAVLRRIRTVLAPDGLLLVVDDQLLASRDELDGDVIELARRWRSPRLRSVDRLTSALAAAGFDTRADLDLTGQVRAGDERTLSSRRRWLRLAGLAPIPSLRLVVDAFLGGIALERLHRRRLCCYRVRVAAAGSRCP